MDQTKNINGSTALNPKHLAAIQKLAQMRTAADEANMGFAAAFVTDDGQNYITSNLREYVVEDYILQLLLTVPFQDEQKGGQICLVETQDGVQLQIVPDAE